MKDLLEQIEDYQDEVKSLLMGTNPSNDLLKSDLNNPAIVKSDDEKEITIRAGEKSIKFEDSDWNVLTDRDLDPQNDTPLLKKDVMDVKNQPKRMGDEDEEKSDSKKLTKSKESSSSVRNPSDTEVEKLVNKIRGESVDLRKFMIDESTLQTPTTPQQRMEESEKRKKQLGDLWDSIL